MKEPSYEDLREFLETHTQIEAAEHFGLSRSRVQRIRKAGEDHRGPVERSIDALIAKRGVLDENRAVRADMLRTAASIADRAGNANTGVGWSAGVQALERLWKMLEDFDSQVNNEFELLRAAIFADPATGEVPESVFGEPVGSN